ncbi:HIT family protein [Streptococcus entericus]|uniref:HIT family protein n=1 Tax=Streptococcus entericus TaxID=155680 RepID=UPI0003602ABF|nr:HIT family protein [Streptococcus entericus]
MTDCIFCQIVSGAIPSSQIYEDEKVLVFLDITQVTPGHTLIIPKQHCKNLIDMSADTARQVFGVVPKLAQALVKATGADGINLINNSEEAAGQTVFHAHIHLLPRFAAGDGLDIRFVQNEPDFGKIAELAKHIQQEVN